MNRGDVVLVEVPYVGSPGAKVRPPLIVQNDALNNRIKGTIIAAITSNLSHAHQPHQLLIDISPPDGIATGLLTNSAVRCERLHTVPQVDIRTIIGTLSAALVAQIDSCLAREGYQRALVAARRALAKATEPGRGTIATLGEYVYRPLKERVEKLKEIAGEE